MNSFGRTGVAVVVAASLFGYIYLVESKKDPSTLTPAEGASKRTKVFPAFDKAKVKSLTLTKRGGEVVEAEKAGDAWTLLAPRKAPADPGEISLLLDALQNLESDEAVNEGGGDLQPFGLKEPKVRVSVVAEGAAKPFEFELGDDVPAGFALFARIPGRPGILTVSSTLENTLNKSAFDLSDRSLVKLKADAIRSFELSEKGRPAFRLARGGEGEDNWKIEAPVATRATRWTVDSMLGLVENLRMESIAAEEASAQDLTRFGLGEGARRLTLNPGEAAPTVLEIGAKTSDGKYYARVASSPQVATISAGLAEDLDKGLRNLRAARLLDVAAYEVTGFDVTTKAATKTFAKSTEKGKGKDGADEIVWKSTAPTRDATQEKVSDALFAIGGLEASEFIDSPKGLDTYGLNAPALRVTLKFDGGKKPDWFEVAVKGDAGFARRRDDTAILKLDKTKTEALIKNFAGLGT